MMHWLFVIAIDGVMSDECLTVGLYTSGCGEDEGHVEGKV
jgi:hypothetical protein